MAWEFFVSSFGEERNFVERHFVDLLCEDKFSTSAPVLCALALSIASAPVLRALAPSIVGDSIALHQDCISCHGFGSWRKRNRLWREDKRRLGLLDENE